MADGEDLSDILNKFIRRAKAGNLKTSGFPKEFKGFKLDISFGMGSPAKVPWIAFLAQNMKVSKGIYPCYLYYKEKDLLILAYGVSEINRPEKSWPDEVINSAKTIASYLNEKVPRYGNSFVFKAYRIEKKGKKISFIYVDTNDKATNKDLEDDLDRLLEKYRNFLSKLQKADKDKSSTTEQKKDLDSKQKLPKNIILHGPVGTGKTFISNIIAQGIIENSIQNISEIEVIIKSEHNNSTDIDPKYRDKIKWVTFHKSYSYEDFIAGIKAVSENGNISYRIEDGIFKEFCDLASKNPDQNYVFIIDEINRGDISRIFGELITLIEEDKRGISINLPFKREGKAIDFSVPDNLYIIGTMNDSDRNIALIDVALRRRFTFFRVGFNENLLSQWLKVLGDEYSNKIKEFVKYLNEEIKTRMGEDYEIGHAFFAPIIKMKDVNEAQDEVYIIFKYRIFPLLEEYFYSDREILIEFLKEFYEYDSSRKNENDRIPVIKAKEFKNFDELMSLIKNTLENRQ